MTTRQEIFSAIGLGSFWDNTWKDYEQLIVETYQSSNYPVSQDGNPREKLPRADESDTVEYLM